MQAHQYADLFPSMTAAEFAALKADIQAYGQREPITTWRGMVVDGRHRERACHELGRPVTAREFDGDERELLAFVISLNVQRRHLNESQRAMVAARIATLGQGARTDLSPIGEKLSQQQAAEVLTVGKRSVERAQHVLDHGTPELIAAVDSGSIAVSNAAYLADATPETQRQVVAKVVSGEASSAIEAVRQVRHQARPTVVLPVGKYRVLYADPPWQYNDQRALEGYKDTAAQDHYPTMSVEQLSALDVGSLAADDAVLFCWATFPLLPDALEVVKAWGFVYKTAFVWCKQRGTFGHYHDASAELLLVCTRGSATPDASQREQQVQVFARNGHSEKPEAFRILIGALYTHGPRIELFARTSTPGWAVWGNQVAA